MVNSKLRSCITIPSLYTYFGAASLCSEANLGPIPSFFIRSGVNCACMIGYLGYVSYFDSESIYPRLLILNSDADFEICVRTKDHLL